MLIFYVLPPPPHPAIMNKIIVNMLFTLFIANDLLIGFKTLNGCKNTTII